jgi:putative oxidoreductase
VATAQTSSDSRVGNILFWLLKILLALAFGAAALAKLTSQPHMVEEFGKIGFGGWFLSFTGGVELLCAVLMLIPRTAFLGALGFVGICVGALAAHLLYLHGDLIHVAVLGALSLVAVWLSRPAALRA